MPLDKPLPPESGWTEAKAPELHKWDKPGETLAGILLRIEDTKIDGKPVPQYVLQLGDRIFKCLATYDLRQKLTSAHRGCQVRIKYLGEDATITGGPNNQPMKIFSVQYKGQVLERPTITDEDIPF
jgi:hypothetical protein